jgi:starch synthase
MSKDTLEDLQTPTTYRELIKLAIKYSDGILINGDNIPQELIDYAESLGKAILPKQTQEENGNNSYDFYNSLLG